MKQKISERIAFPLEIQCSFENNTLKCNKNSTELSRKIWIPGVNISFDKEKNELVFSSKKVNKKGYKTIQSFVKHTRNMIHGLNEEYSYSLEACNVHFPMTLKIEGSRIEIKNFLGEKIPRYSEIVSGASVKISGQNITVTSSDKEAAGQTAANLEKATKVRGRDRRIFQDGIYIVKKPGRED